MGWRERRSAPLAMVVVHDVLVPMRFLALVGHFLASVLALFAVVRPCSLARIILRLPDPPSHRNPIIHQSATLRAPVCLQRDNVIVSLPFNYNPDELIWRMWAARAAMYVLMACLAVNAVSFFGGFSTFDVGLSVFREPRYRTRAQIMTGRARSALPQCPRLCGRRSQT